LKRKRALENKRKQDEVLDDLFNVNKPDVAAKETKNNGGLTGLDELEAEEGENQGSSSGSPNDNNVEMDGDANISDHDNEKIEAHRQKM
jgi:hypothetical protein